MNDCATMCASCNRASNGEQYCRRCEAAIEAKERENEERGFALPVRASMGKDYWFIRCADGGFMNEGFSVKRGDKARELAEVIAAAINEHYSDEAEGA